MSDTHIWNVEVLSPTTGSATFREPNPVSGQTIHADFTWDNAVMNWTSDTYAMMYIQDPDGNTVDYEELTQSSGSYTLSAVMDLPGIWYATIGVWDGNEWLSFNDTVSLASACFKIIFSESTFEEGPVAAGAQMAACVLTVENVGNMSAMGVLRLYEHPNTPSELEIHQQPIPTILAGAYLSNIVVPIYATETEGTWPLGIKVHAIGEHGEPAPVW